MSKTSISFAINVTYEQVMFILFFLASAILLKLSFCEKI